MNCNEIMDRYLELDKGERVPFHITWHLLTCRKCRQQIALLRLAEKTVAKSLEIPVPLNDSTIEAVMKKIQPESDISSQNPISIRKWIFGGILMIILMLEFGFITDPRSDNMLTLSFYLIFSAIIITYCALFIGTNMDFFIKKIETRRIQL